MVSRKCVGTIVGPDQWPVMDSGLSYKVSQARQLRLPTAYYSFAMVRPLQRTSVQGCWCPETTYAKSSGACCAGSTHRLTTGNHALRRTKTLRQFNEAPALTFVTSPSHAIETLTAILMLGLVRLSWGTVRDSGARFTGCQERPICTRVADDGDRGRSAGGMSGVRVARLPRSGSATRTD